MYVFPSLIVCMILISGKASIEQTCDHSEPEDELESIEIHIETSKMATALLPLPKASPRISVKKNKKSLPTPKTTSLDLNQPYLEFKERLIQLVFVKLGLQLDPFDEPDIKFYQAWKTKTRVTGNKKGFSLNDYCDLDDEDDYEGLQLDIQCSATQKNGIEKMVLLILAFITIEEANIAGRGNQEFLDELESDSGIIEPSKRKVLF